MWARARRSPGGHVCAGGWGCPLPTNAHCFWRVTEWGRSLSTAIVKPRMDWHSRILADYRSAFLPVIWPLILLALPAAPLTHLHVRIEPYRMGRPPGAAAGSVLTVRVGESCVVERYWDFPRVGPAPVVHGARRCRRWRPCSTIALERTLDTRHSGQRLSQRRRRLVADCCNGCSAQSGASRLSRSVFPKRSTMSCRFSEKVARHLGTEQHTQIIHCDDVIDALPHLVRRLH